MFNVRESLLEKSMHDGSNRETDWFIYTKVNVVEEIQQCIPQYHLKRAPVSSWVYYMYLTVGMCVC